MIRPRYTWIAFGASLAVALAAMGWISLTALRLDRAEAEARRQAALEENVRLALWRIDSSLTPIIAREGARPYFAYTAFYPAERTYTRMFAEIRSGEILVPSPLLTLDSAYVLLHYQFGPDGDLSSPQVPSGNMRDLAEVRYTTHERINASGRLLAQLRERVGRDALLKALPEDAAHETPAAVPHVPRQEKQAVQAFAQQSSRSAAEWQARAKTYRHAAVQKESPGKAAPRPGDVKEGVMKPVWVAGTLLLARRVTVNGRVYLQGAWLDWPATRERLLSGVRDLLPEADLVPADADAPEKEARRLASLPVTLAPGAVAAEAGRAFSPIRLALAVAWACVLLGGAAVAALLRGAMSLSERRGAFVSAVTHELRTPLTTFRMYAEMLDEGMVGEEKRGSYVKTLRTEADRLGHLVENVLAYARLEGGAGARVETLSLEEIVGRAKARLAERAEEAGMDLVVEEDEELSSTGVRADGSAVEQILFNLVDNACKYAASAEDARIHLEAAREGEFVVLRVRDHGPGVSKEDARKLFRPFSKSARDAASSAPGVGLGLALSRRLAREMGGELRLEEGVEGGACFALVLPVA